MVGGASDADLARFLTRVGRQGGRSEQLTVAAARLIAADPATEAFASLGADPAALADERVDLFACCVRLCPEVALEVAGHAVQARMGPRELWRFYLPLCQVIRALPRSKAERTLVGIAGAGASGKSVFAGLLAAVLQAGQQGGGTGVAVCSMDGFHRSNAYLDTHFTRDSAGRRASLRTVKGAPETFDAQAFVRCLRDLKAGRDLTVPRYDRRLHDPVADGARIGPQQRVVLVEGNYLLMDRGAWADVAGLLDLRLFLTTPAQGFREAMIDRHMRGGRSADDAARHFEHVDEPNSRLILSTLPRADLLIWRDVAQRITGIELPTRGGQSR